MIPNCNNGTSESPQLRRDINMGTLLALPDWSSAPKVEGQELMHALKEMGFGGVQGGDPEVCRDAGLGCAGSFRTSKLGIADELVKQRKDQGYDALTTHAGWGMEDDSESDAYVNEIIDASVAYNIPIYIETHRATITQDIWRTVQLIQRNPAVRFNGDFSHWYTGLEMPYGSVEDKLSFLEPVFNRVRFFHGRIGNSSHIQVPFSEADDNVAVFKEMWTRSMLGFLRTAQPGDFLPFAPELLPPSTHYARVFPDADGNLREESDRWQQALLMVDIAQDCFEAAVQSLHTS